LATPILPPADDNSHHTLHEDSLSSENDDSEESTTRGDMSSSPDVDETRVNDLNNSSAASDISSPQFLLPGSHRHDPNSAGPRRMTRPSRPPVWLKDYVYRILQPYT
jgi:hypothetical protein